MKRIAIVSLIGIFAALLYGAFFHTSLCVMAASKRVEVFSDIGLCPAFIQAPLDVLSGQLLEILEVGDEASKIESTLTSLDITYSWDRSQDRYQGIIRDQSSSFHAITIFVYVDEQQKFTELEVNDAFNAL